MPENHISDLEIALSDDVEAEEVYSHENGEILIEEEEEPVSEVVDEVPDDAQIAESSSKVEEVPKKSYASIVSS